MGKWVEALEKKVNSSFREREKRKRKGENRVLVLAVKGTEFVQNSNSTDLATCH